MIAPTGPQRKTWNSDVLGESETMPIECFEEYTNKPDMLKVASLASLVENLTTTDLGLRPLGPFGARKGVWHINDIEYSGQRLRRAFLEH